MKTNVMQASLFGALCAANIYSAITVVSIWVGEGGVSYDALCTSCYGITSNRAIDKSNPHGGRMKPLSRIIIVVAALSLALACASSPPARCPELSWPNYTADQSPSEHLTADQAVISSATYWALNRNSGPTVTTTCGDKIKCADVAVFVQAVGGKVTSVQRCAVMWEPEPGVKQ